MRDGSALVLHKEDFLFTLSISARQRLSISLRKAKERNALKVVERKERKCSRQKSKSEHEKRWQRESRKSTNWILRSTLSY